VTGRCGVVVAHGSLANGLLAALSRVAGEQDSLWALSNEGLGGADLEAKIAGLIEERCAGRDTYLLSDMEGGSCGQACRRLLAKGAVKAVFYGVNLPLLVEFVFLREESFDRFLTAAVEKGRRALGAHA
jgi:mannose/fructose-specific phosphotransferase system component IIA